MTDTNCMDPFPHIVEVLKFIAFVYHNDDQTVTFSLYLQLTVRATDRPQLGGREAFATVIINVLRDTADPQFSQEVYTIPGVRENVGVGTPIGSVQASDQDLRVNVFYLCLLAFWSIWTSYRSL